MIRDADKVKALDEDVAKLLEKKALIKLPREGEYPAPQEGCCSPHVS